MMFKLCLLPVLFALFVASCVCFADNKKMFERAFKLFHTLINIGLAKAEKQVQKIK